MRLVRRHGPLVVAIALVLPLALAGCAGVASPTPSVDASSPPPSTAGPSPTSGLASATAGASVTGTPSAGATSQATPPAALGELSWRTCHQSLECATLPVPLDYEAPAGETIGIALVRRPADDQAGRIGALLYNPGGPGGSGVEAVVGGSDFIFSEELRRRFDIVGFDPRGVGESQAVRCLPRRPVAESAFPDEPEEREAWFADAKTVAEACGAGAGELLEHVETANVARDLDRIRDAMGDPGLTYLGHSYGTLIGALYAELFPGRVRALVLDGAVDPGLEGSELIKGQAISMDAALGRFFAWCEEDDGCQFAEGEDTAEAFDELMGSFEDEPVDGVAGTTAWNAVAVMLFGGDFAGLANALAGAEQGDPSDLAAFGAFLEDPGLLDAYAGVACADLMGERGPEAWEAFAAEIETVAPRSGRFLAYASGWGAVECAFWPVARQRDPSPIRASGAPPILVVSATGDPATPHAWGEALAAQLESGVLLTREGEGHTSYPRGPCIVEAVDQYLLALEPPVDGHTCRDEALASNP